MREPAATGPPANKKDHATIFFVKKDPHLSKKSQNIALTQQEPALSPYHMKLILSLN